MARVRAISDESVRPRWSVAFAFADLLCWRLAAMLAQPGLLALGVTPAPPRRCAAAIVSHKDVGRERVCRASRTLTAIRGGI